MGIRGFYTYISRNAPESFKWIKLKDCNLVIDGSNLAYHMYLYTDNINLAYGGDYVLYARHISEFFANLLKCNIVPLVVMDGGHPLHGKKFETTKQRLADHITNCQIINPSNQHCSNVFPLMVRVVFTNVLHKLGIKCVTADFEADEHIAVIAKKLDSFILSNDSDFFLYDVKLIVLNSINMEKVKEQYDGKTKGFITCYRFDRQQFCKSTGVSLQLLPLLAVIVGNDCHPIELMADFINSISKGRYYYLSANPKRHTLIRCVLNWLSYQKSKDPATVVKMIASRVEKKRRNIDSLTDCLRSYYPKESNLLSWFMSHHKKCPAANVIMEPRPIFLVDFKRTSSLIPTIEPQMSCSCAAKQQSNLCFDKGLPKWFTFSFRFNLAACISTETLNQPSIFAMPQIEETSKACVHLPAENIIRAMRGILWKTALLPKNKCSNAGHKKADEAASKISDATAESSVSNMKVLRKAQNTKMIPNLVWYMRKGNILMCRPIKKCPLTSFAHLPDLYAIEKLSLEEKKKIFFNISGINEDFLQGENCPKILEIVLLFIYHWRQTVPDLDDSVFYSVIISAMMFLIVRGRHFLKKERYTPTLAEKYILQVESLTEKDTNEELASKSIAEIIDSLTPEECQLANFDLSAFNRETKKLQGSFRRSTVHNFGAYQCSVFYLGVLNSVMCFPFPDICISNFWSGTFCYSIERFLDYQESPFKAIKLLFNVNKRLIHLFDRLCCIFHNAFGVKKQSKKDNVSNTELRTHKENILTMIKDKIERRPLYIPSGPEYDIVESPTQEDIDMLAGNSFGALLLIPAETQAASTG